MAETNRKAVVILTDTFRIKGEIAVAPDERVTDYVIQSKNFIALTDVEVWNLDGRLMFTSTFINVHRDHIVVIAPEDLTARN